MPEFVAKGMKGEYKPVKRPDARRRRGRIPRHRVRAEHSRTNAGLRRRRGAGSPAAKAGLRPDDLVSFVDGEPIVSIKAFHEWMKRKRGPAR